MLFVPVTSMKVHYDLLQPVRVELILVAEVAVARTPARTRPSVRSTPTSAIT